MLEEMLSDPDSAFQPEAYLYQDFSVRCRMQKLKKVPLDLAAFRRRFALAKGACSIRPSRAGARCSPSPIGFRTTCSRPSSRSRARAMDGEPCPDDDILGRAYGSRSPGRIRRLVEYMEKQGVIVVRRRFRRAALDRNPRTRTQHRGRVANPSGTAPLRPPSGWSRRCRCALTRSISASSARMRVAQLVHRQRIERLLDQCREHIVAAAGKVVIVHGVSSLAGPCAEKARDC